MSTLSAFLKQSSSTGEGVATYVEEMMGKYPRVWATSELQTVREFRWSVRYSNTSQLVFTILLMLIGRNRYNYTETKFSTFHLLNKDEVFRLRSIMFFKGLLDPLFTILMLLGGFVTVVFGGGLIFFAFHPPQPPISPAAWKGDLTIEGSAIVLFLICYFIKTSFSKVGYPPGTGEDFKHRMISLLSSSAVK